MPTPTSAKNRLVTGNGAGFAVPVTKALPAASTTTERSSDPFEPMKVENSMAAPDGASLVTNPAGRT